MTVGDVSTAVVETADVVDAVRLREAIVKLLPSKDLNSTSVKALRTELEEVLGLSPGGLDAQRELVKELLLEEIATAQARDQDVEADDTSAPRKRPGIDLDLPLLALSSIEDFGDSSSDSDAGEKEKKSKKAKRARVGSIAPTPLRRRDRGREVSKKSKGSSGKAGTEHKAERFKSKVEIAVQQYIDDHPESWTASEMREDISQRHGWENDTKLANLVKATLAEFGFSNSGANVLKGCR